MPQDWSVAALAQRNGFVLSKTESFPRSRFPYYTPVWGDDRDFERRQPWQIYAGGVRFLRSFGGEVVSDDGLGPHGISFFFDAGLESKLTMSLQTSK